MVDQLKRDQLSIPCPREARQKEDEKVSQQDGSFELYRFVEAQNSVYEDVCSELRRGKKRTHWMWFIFPQIDGLAASSTARFYAIRSKAEAKAYVENSLLGDRLRECVSLVLMHKKRTATDIFGSPDDLKLRSSLTLFDATCPGEELFQLALRQFYRGEPDLRTLDFLRSLDSRTK